MEELYGAAFSGIVVVEFNPRGLEFGHRMGEDGLQCEALAVIGSQLFEVDVNLGVVILGFHALNI